MLLGDVVRKYPKTAPVMFKYGLHCIGCHVSAYESIEQGCTAHGIKEEDIDKMVKEMNDVAEK
ncbi:DUF1858 domain-containing protein [Candidatus Woesearchaeota archaeon]|nr:DUF1858 domain-containing protein [Candidatus Woesearchaeota archaeon]